MTFLIADTFTDSLARLTGDEQKAVKTTAFDLQMNPSAPGLSFHKLDSTRNQRQLVTKDYSAPRVAGSAGTGKTVVALHRAVHVARPIPNDRILLATFSEPLAHALRAGVKRLARNEPRVLERLEVHAMNALGLRLHRAQLGSVRLASSEDVSGLLREASCAARLCRARRGES
jgi:hypothetical protein